MTSIHYFGGVAVFNESLARGLEQCGCEVVLCSRQKPEEIRIEKCQFRQISYKNVSSVIKREMPDAIISSLDYAIYYPFISTDVIKAHYLHGFFNIAHYGVVKSYLGWLYQKKVVGLCDRIYANSFFTQMVNQDIMGLRVDKTIPIGVSETILEKSVSAPVLSTRINKRIIYVGRLARSKFVDNIIKSVIDINSTGYRCELEILGDGPDADRLKKIAKGNDSILFYGRVDHEKVYEKESQAELFISLCPSESYGMSFIEALLAGCKIVCPHTGGQNEFIEEYKDKRAAFPISFIAFRYGDKETVSRFFGRNCVTLGKHDIKFYDGRLHLALILAVKCNATKAKELSKAIKGDSEFFGSETAVSASALDEKFNRIMEVMGNPALTDAKIGKVMRPDSRTEARYRTRNENTEDKKNA